DMLGHELELEHATSQAHESLQLIDGQASEPEQSIEHCCGPQSIAAHEPGPEHSMSQPLPWVQSMLPHAPGLLHRIAQSNPLGHCTRPHVWPWLHEIRQVLAPRSHELHWLGQPLSTQNPSTHARPSAQLPSLPHAYCSDSRWTEQLATASAPSPA